MLLVIGLGVWLCVRVSLLSLHQHNSKTNYTKSKFGIWYNWYNLVFGIWTSKSKFGILDPYHMEMLLEYFCENRTNSYAQGK